MLRENPALKFSDGFVSQVLFPAEKLTRLKSHSYLVGWNLDNFRCCISFIVEIPEQQYEQLCEIIRLSCVNHMKLLSSCSKTGNAIPVILGEFIPNLANDYVPDVSRRMEGIWITLTTDGIESKYPKLRSLYSLGCLYSTSCYLFEYSYVDTDKLVCLKPEQTVNPDKNVSVRLSFGSELDFIIAQINASSDLENTIRHNLRRDTSREPLIVGRFNRLVTSVISASTVVVSVPSWLWYLASRRVDRALKHKYELFYMGALFATWLGLRGAGSIDATGGSNAASVTQGETGASPPAPGDRAFSTSSAAANAEGISICDISLCAAHLSERIARFEACLRKCGVFPYSWSLPARLKQSLWVSVFSFMIVLWVDVVIGCVVGCWIFRHAEEITLFLEQSSDRAQRHFILESLDWFNHSPGGVKLNSLVTIKAGAALKALMGTYHTVLVDTKALHLPIVKFVGCFGALGITSQLVLLVDVMRLATLHIAATHRILAFFHQQQLQLLYSLSLLFQGEKRNTLRRRVDTCEYDQAQLLFGTVLFAVMLFLFPSFAAFYYLFAFAQFGVVLFQYLLWSTAVAIKEFPLYAMGLYFFDPALLSRGLQFSILHVGNANETVPVRTKQHSPARTEPAPAFFEYERPGRSRSGENRNSEKVAFFQEVSASPISKERLSVEDQFAPSGSIRGILKSAPSLSLPVNSSSASKQSPLVLTVEELADDVEVRRRGSSNTVHFEQVAKEGGSSDSNSSVDRQIHSPLPHMERPQYQSRYGGDSVSIISPNSFGRGGSNSPVGDSSPGARRRTLVKDSGGSATSQQGGFTAQSNSTVYLRLLPRMQSLREVFSGYFPYMQYIASEKGFLWRLLQGVFLGRPALDIQLIHATATLAHNKSLSEQMDISAAFAAANLDNRSDDVQLKGFQDLGDVDDIKMGTRSGPQSAFNANCFRPPESSGTIKNRKGVSNRMGPSLMLPSNGSNSGMGSAPHCALSSLDFSVVYDLPQNGFSIQTSFWETLRLAKADGDGEDAFVDSVTSPAAGDCLEAVFAPDGETNSHREDSTFRLPLTKRVNLKQRGLSTVLLYSMLLTAALSLLLVSFGSVVFLSSLVPVRWMREVSHYGGSVGRLQTGSFLTSKISSALISSRSENNSRPLNHSQSLADISPLIAKSGTSPIHTEILSESHIADQTLTVEKGVRHKVTATVKSAASVGRP